MTIDEGTLYPLLRRLESQGLLASEWREEDKRTKRFYRLSPQGRLFTMGLLLGREVLFGFAHQAIERRTRSGGATTPTATRRSPCASPATPPSPATSPPAGTGRREGRPGAS